MGGERGLFTLLGRGASPSLSAISSVTDLCFKGPSLLEWIPDFHVDGPLLLRSVPRGRAYSSVIFEPSTCLIVAASSLRAKFASFDEDGNKIWEPDGESMHLIIQRKPYFLRSAKYIRSYV